MTISVLLITHEEVGNALVNATASALGGELPLPTTVVSIDHDTNVEDLTPRLQHYVDQIEAGEGLLILTDLFGSTPCNIARNLGDKVGVRVVSGLNLPMLIRLMNYSHLDIDSLADKALTGGKEGVMDCKDNDDN